MDDSVPIGKQVPLCILGFKSDIESLVPTAEGRDYARIHSALFYETSSKLDINVSKSFVEFTTHIIGMLSSMDAQSEQHRGISRLFRLFRCLPSSPSAETQNKSSWSNPYLSIGHVGGIWKTIQFKDFLFSIYWTR